MPGERSFQLLFETFGKLPECHAPSVNGAALSELRNLLDAPVEAPGHCILLKAPRAGHGKTHLLTRLQHELGGSHEFVPVHASGGCRISPSSVLDDTLRRLVRSLPAAGGLTVFDLVARRLFSSALQPLVRSGEVPCQDREGALNALRTRPVETFDFHHPSAVTAHWAKENFELLGPRLALELSQANGLPHRETAFWVDAMFRFASTPIDNPGRVRTLSETVFEDPSAELAAHDRLASLLGLMSTMLRVVLVADELEGFSSDETAALSFASFVGALRQSVDRLEIILSLNQDIWESAFLPRLSGGLADRLSEVTVELEPLDREGMIAVIESRAPGMGEQILSQLDSNSIPSYARGLIKKAGQKTPKESSLSTQTEQLGGFSTEKPDRGPWPKEQPPEAPQEPVQAAAAPTLAPMQPEPPAFQPEPAAAQPAPPPVQSAPQPAETGFSPEAAIAAFSNFQTEEPAQPEATSAQPEPTPVQQEREPQAAETGFSAEAAIAAFGNFQTEQPLNEEGGGFLPPSDPSSPYAAPQGSAPQPKEEPSQSFSASAVEPPASEAPTQAQPEPPAAENPFQMAPAEDPIQPPADSVFQKAPAENPFSPAQQSEPQPTEQHPQPYGANAPEQRIYQDTPFPLPPTEQPPAQVFQAAPPASEPSASEAFTPAPQPDPDEQEAKTDRVDDLLKQFRERYGKS
ncbi:MAG: hypothetical protein ABJM75_08005 [Luteolibacter sp.]